MWYTINKVFPIIFLLIFQKIIIIIKQMLSIRWKGDNIIEHGFKMHQKHKALITTPMDSTYSADSVETRQAPAAVFPAYDQLDFAPTESASSDPSTLLQYNYLVDVCKFTDNHKMLAAAAAAAATTTTTTPASLLLHYYHHYQFLF